MEKIEKRVCYIPSGQCWGSEPRELHFQHLFQEFFEEKLALVEYSGDIHSKFLIIFLKNIKIDII
jgi:hypothetical protein